MALIRFAFEADCDNEDTSRFIRTFVGSIYELIDNEASDDDLKEVPVGTVNVILIQRDRIVDAEESLFEAMEENSHETCECFESIFDFESNDWNAEIESLYEPEMLGPFNLLLIEKIEVNHDWRGKGIGSSVIREVVSIFRSSCGLICCKPFPLQYSGWQEREETTKQKNEREEAFHRIKEFWKSLGFRDVPGSEFVVFSPEFDVMPID
jgi:GNAT superfamily N-acetyltransferase